MENKPIFVLLVGGKSERMGLPKGILFKTHENVQDYDHSNDEIFNLH